MSGFSHVPPLEMRGTSAAWELLVCAGIGLLISGISDGLSNFFVVITCVAVAVSWLTFSNVTAGLLFLMLYLFLLMVACTSFPCTLCSGFCFGLFARKSHPNLLSLCILQIRLYRAIGGALSFLSPIPLVRSAI